MPIDPSLITQTLAHWQVPQVAIPDPLERYAKLQALKSGIVQQQVQQAQLQNYQAEVQQKQMDMRDSQTVMQALQDPAAAKAVAAWQPGTPFPLTGIQYKTAQALQDKVLADQKNALTLSDAQRASALAKHAQIADALKGLAYNADGTPRADADIARDAPQTFQDLVTQGVIPQGTPMPQITGAADLQKYAVANNYQQQLNQFAQGAQKQAQEIATSKATASKDTAEADKAKEDTRKTKMVNDAMDAALKDPTQGDALIDQAIPPSVDPQANAGYKAARRAAIAAGNPEAAAQVVAAAANHGAGMSNAAINFAARKAGAEEAAKGPAQVANEVAKQKALAANSTEMFAGISDPATRRAAQADYQKYTTDFFDKNQNAAQLQDFIAAAKSGNKAAPGLIPMGVVRTIVNRVSTPELKAQVGGSVADKVEGWLKGATEGQPIPSDILDGMSQIADIEARNNRAAYENKVNALGATYGGNARPALPRAAQPPAAGGAAQGAGAKNPFR
jgi:hypothetical protein